MQTRTQTVAPETAEMIENANSEPLAPLPGQNLGDVTKRRSSKDISETELQFRKIKKNINNFMETTTVQLFSAALVLLSLFLPDSWILGNAPDEEDSALSAVLLAIFIYFCIEIFILSIAQKNYFGGFFFWMDVLGTFSIILDISWIADSFIPSGAVSNQGSVVRSTRAARLGARFGRLLRLLRIFRILRQLPCLSFMDKNNFEPTMSAIKKISDDLSNSLSTRTAILVLLLVIVVPFMSTTITDYSPNAWITNIKLVAKNESSTWADFEKIGYKCEKFYEPKAMKLKDLYFESPWYGETFNKYYQTRSVLRTDNIVYYDSFYYVANETLANSGNPFALDYLTNSTFDGRNNRFGSVQFKVRLEFDNTETNQSNAMFSILIIILVIVCLFSFTLSFNSVVSKLVVQPLERMMLILRSSAMTMLKSLKVLEVAKKEEEEEDKRKSDEDSDDENLETEMLENIVEKVSRIIQHVLPSNNEIITENMDKSTANWLTQAYAKTEKSNFSRGGSVVINTDISKMMGLLSEDLRRDIDSWDFDVVNHDNIVLHNVMAYLFNSLSLLDTFKVPEHVFNNFLRQIAAGYLDNTYHNYKHGCDVCFTSYRLMVIPKLTSVLSTLEVFSVLVGAIAHDVGHPGLNNMFLVKAKHELALLHNDRSPLENMHCCKLYEILGNEATNIFINLDDKQWRESRQIILTIVLGTDMSHHFEQINKSQLFLEVNGADTKSFCNGEKSEMECMKDEKNRLFVMELVLHCSDISNPFKPFALCAKWADLVVEEFCLQGDKEKSLGLPVSPMCDRDSVALCNMQMGFIEFVVAPLIIAFVNIFPPTHEIGINMSNNFCSWGERRLVEIAGQEEECKKLQERMQKFRDKLSFCHALSSGSVRKKSL